MSCGKVCEKGLPKVKLKQEVGKEGSDASRKYVARVGLKLDVALVVLV